MTLPVEWVTPLKTYGRKKKIKKVLKSPFDNSLTKKQRHPGGESPSREWVPMSRLKIPQAKRGWGGRHLPFELLGKLTVPGCGPLRPPFRKGAAQRATRTRSNQITKKLWSGENDYLGEETKGPPARGKMRPRRPPSWAVGGSPSREQTSSIHNPRAGNLKSTTKRRGKTFWWLQRPVGPGNFGGSPHRVKGGFARVKGSTSSFLIPHGTWKKAGKASRGRREVRKRKNDRLPRPGSPENQKTDKGQLSARCIHVNRGVVETLKEKNRRSKKGQSQKCNFFEHCASCGNKRHHQRKNGVKKKSWKGTALKKGG